MLHVQFSSPAGVVRVIVIFVAVDVVGPTASQRQRQCGLVGRSLVSSDSDSSTEIVIAPPTHTHVIPSPAHVSFYCDRKTQSDDTGVFPVELHISEHGRSGIEREERQKLRCCPMMAYSLSFLIRLRAGCWRNHRPRDQHCSRTLLSKNRLLYPAPMTLLRSNRKHFSHILLLSGQTSAKM